MTRKSEAFALGLHTASPRPFEFYPTPHHAIEALLDREEFVGPVWEPASGDGRIVVACRRRGIECFGTDIQQGVDFLRERRHVANIVTNPPFRLADRFYRHALRLAQRKVVMLGQINAIVGLKRYQTIYRFWPLARVYVFVERLQFVEKKHSLHDYCWLVWDRNHQGPTELHHIYDPSDEQLLRRLMR
jgi:hypothetical protein